MVRPGWCRSCYNSAFVSAEHGAALRRAAHRDGTAATFRVHAVAPASVASGGSNSFPGRSDLRFCLNRGGDHATQLVVLAESAQTVERSTCNGAHMGANSR